MMVVVQINSSGLLTARFMICMTSLTEILLAHCVTNIAITLSHNSHLQKETECDGRLTAQFGM